MAFRPVRRSPALSQHLGVRIGAEPDLASPGPHPRSCQPARKVTVRQRLQLIESLSTDTLVGLRDRALIGLMAYTFARIGAALLMDVGDYYLSMLT